MRRKFNWNYKIDVVGGKYMIVVMKPTVREDTINFVKSNLEKCGVEVNVSQGGTYCILGLVGDSSKIDPDKILTYEGVEKVLKVQDPFKRLIDYLSLMTV